VILIHAIDLENKFLISTCIKVEDAKSRQKKENDEGNEGAFFHQKQSKV